MATKVMINNPKTGMVKKGFFGFSWTYLFFGWLVPLFRGELGVAALHLLFTIFTLGIWNLIMSFHYNKQYMTRMMEQDWALQDNETKMQLARQKLGIVAAHSSTN